MKNMNKDEAKIWLDILINIIRYKDYFLRNVFRANSKCLKRNEMNYLLRLTDGAHNLPEFVKKLLNIINEKETDISSFTFYINELGLLRKLVSDLEYVYNCNIKINNIILGWMAELSRMKQYCDLFINKVKEDGE